MIAELSPETVKQIADRVRSQQTDADLTRRVLRQTWLWVSAFVGCFVATGWGGYKLIVSLNDANNANIRSIVTEVVEKENKALKSEISEMVARRMAELETKVPITEFIGRGSVPFKGPYRPGDRVPHLFLMRRNLACGGEIEVNFVSGKTGQIVSAYSRKVQLRKAKIGLEFDLFYLEVQLPEDMAPGRYAYWPVYTPNRTDEICRNAKKTEIPISDFFDVVAK